MFRKQVILVCTLALLVLGNSVAIADEAPDELTPSQIRESIERGLQISDKIERYEARYKPLHDKFLAKMKTDLGARKTFEESLSFFGAHVDKMDSELLALMSFTRLNSLVTNKKFMPMATKIVEYHRAYTMKGVRNSISSIEQVLHLSKVKETTASAFGSA